jgi:hypothetical protein
MNKNQNKNYMILKLRNNFVWGLLKRHNSAKVVYCIKPKKTVPSQLESTAGKIVNKLLRRSNAIPEQAQVPTKAYFPLHIDKTKERSKLCLTKMSYQHFSLKFT